MEDPQTSPETAQSLPTSSKSSREYAQNPPKFRRNRLVLKSFDSSAYTDGFPIRGQFGESCYPVCHIVIHKYVFLTEQLVLELPVRSP